MLGQLEVVKAFVAAQPGIHLQPGPHGIPLLAYAFAGVPPPLVIPETEKTLLSGVYRFGPEAHEIFTVSTNKALFQFTRPGRPARKLALVSGWDFHPVGAPSVRIRCAETPSELTLQIFDPGLVLSARRPKA